MGMNPQTCSPQKDLGRFTDPLSVKSVLGAPRAVVSCGQFVEGHLSDSPLILSLASPLMFPFYE